MNQLTRYKLGILLLRLVVGSIFILHGSQKVLGVLGGPGLSGFASWAAKYGIWSIFAYAAAFAEFLGGILIFLGIITELGLVLTAGVMLGAVFLIHWPNGYFGQNGGFEYPLNLIFLNIILFITGPGYLALYDPFYSE